MGRSVILNLPCAHIGKNKMSRPSSRVALVLLLWLCSNTLAVLGSESDDNDDTTDCTLGESMQGYEALTTFSSCSGIEIGEIQAVETRIEGDKELRNLFFNKAKECSQYSNILDKQLCISEYLALFAEEEILPADRDLVNTCTCLTDALDALPTCGIFDTFHGITSYNVLPNTYGVCGDLASACGNVDSFASVCLDSGRTRYSPTDCSSVKDRDPGCVNSAEFLWKMGSDSLQFCNLDSQSEFDLKLFVDSCPAYFSVEATETETAATKTKKIVTPSEIKSQSSTMSWVFGSFGLVIVMAAIFLGTSLFRKGALNEFLNPRGYVSVPTDQNDFILSAKSDMSPNYL